MLKYKYDLKAGSSCLDIIKDSDLLISLPLSVSINGISSEFEGREQTDDEITLFGKDQTLTAAFFDDCITLNYKRRFDEPTSIFEVKAFDGGIRFPSFDRAFTPQARNNGHKNLDFFAHLPDISSNGYFTPPILQFTIGSARGNVSFGLLDIPSTKLCKLTEQMSFLVESLGGNIAVSEYSMPELVIYFPRDEWEAISDFRELLIRFGRYTPEKSLSQIPEWWKRPMVCIYGDQLTEDCVGKAIDQEWVEQIARLAKTEWEMQDFNFVIDDSWQLSHSMMPVVDEARFPDLRGFIENMHAEGHHVLLWMTPLMDKITNGFRTRSQELGLITDHECPGGYYKQFPGTYYIDYTSDSARQFLRECCEMLFGKGKGALNADGVKLDFLSNHRDPAESRTYQHPESGMGMREMYLFYKLFYEEAKRVKPDAIIDATVGDPRFEKFVDFNRMHDTHSGNIEKDLRVRISTLACPELLVDSDGALMFKAWLKAHYIDAAVYGIPANYYTKKYQDYTMKPEDYRTLCAARTPEEHERLSLLERKQLGRLLQMVKHRPEGTPLYTGGGWVLKDGERITAQSKDGMTVVYYPTEKCSTGYIFTFKDEVIELPLYGRKFSALRGGDIINGNLQVDYARDRVLLHIEPGTLYTFEDKDGEDSIERAFARGITAGAEGDTDYVN